LEKKWKMNVSAECTKFFTAIPEQNGRFSTFSAHPKARANNNMPGAQKNDPK